MSDMKKRRKKKKRVKILTASQCWVTREEIPLIDYKDVDLLERFLTPHGKMMSRRRAGVNVQKMTEAKRAIKRAQHLALLPFKVY